MHSRDAGGNAPIARRARVRSLHRAAPRRNSLLAEQKPR